MVSSLVEKGIVDKIINKYVPSGIQEKVWCRFVQMLLCQFIFLKDVPPLEPQRLVYFYLPGSLWLGLLALAALVLTAERRRGEKRRSSLQKSATKRLPNIS